MAVERALVSVYDKTGVEEFGKRLAALGIEIVSTGGTARLLRDAGVKVLDVAALTEAVAGFAPDIVLHQLTDLPDDVARIADHFDANNRVRRQGTANLLVAASAAPGSPRTVAQSVAWPLPGAGGAATEALEQAVLEAGGVVGRYGQFYGPGTFHPDVPPAPPKIHVDEAAGRTVDLLTAPSGVVVVEEPVSPDHG